jgi:hypothetical protein
MWRELVLEMFGDAVCGEPASEKALADVAEALGQPLPLDLASLLAECDGVRGPTALDVVWSAERIVRDNLAFRSTPDFRSLYMPFEPVMFFGDNGGGDHFAFVRQPERDEVFVWDHETDSRYLVAYSLRDYLTRALKAQGDWYRND